MLSDQFCVGIWQLGDSRSIRHLFLVPQVLIYKVGINIFTAQGSIMASLNSGLGNVLHKNTVINIDLGDKFRLGH